jgi:hypothetical protein
MEATSENMFKFEEFCEISYKLDIYDFKVKAYSAWSCEAASYY